MASFMTQDRQAACLAIGSAGEGVGGYTKYKDCSRRTGGLGAQRKDASEDYGLLATKQDIQDFKKWSSKHNYVWFGSSEFSGRCGKIKESIAVIHDFLRFCKQKQLRPIIYYTGHGDEDGDWVFPDGTIKFDDVESYNNTIDTGFVVNVIADCCYSGKWVQQSAQKTKMNVLAASAPEDCAIDRIFAQAYFGWSAEHMEVLRDIRAIYSKYDGRNCCNAYAY
jgi:hypothetical protein